MPLCFMIVSIPIADDFLLKLLKGCVDRAYGLFHQDFEVSPLLVHFILEVQSFLLEGFCYLFSIHLQF